jgi:rubredoxin
MILMDWRCPVCGHFKARYPAVEHISQIMYAALRKLAHKCPLCEKESRMTDVEKTDLGFEVHYEEIIHEEIH